MSKKVIGITLFILLVFWSSFASAGQLDTERRLKEWGPFWADKEKNIYWDSSYDYSWVRIGSRKTLWKLLTNRLMYFVKGQLPYLEFNFYDRSGDDDYTINFGSYFNFKDSSLHLEAGFGMNIDYIYRFQTSLEYQHRVYKNWYGKLGARYLDYDTGDSYIISPGIIYYFGNHYLTADYNAVATEARRVGHSGTFRLNLALIGSRVYAYGGGAVGQRLFDIYEVNPSKQGGFILFSGIEVRLFKDLKGRIGYSYSEERPNFVSRSIDSSLSFKF